MRNTISKVDGASSSKQKSDSYLLGTDEAIADFCILPIFLSCLNYFESTPQETRQYTTIKVNNQQSKKMLQDEHVHVFSGNYTG